MKADIPAQLHPITFMSWQKQRPDDVNMLINAYKPLNEYRI